MDLCVLMYLSISIYLDITASFNHFNHLLDTHIVDSFNIEIPVVVMDTYDVNR